MKNRIKYLLPLLLLLPSCGKNETAKETESAKNTADITEKTTSEKNTFPLSFRLENVIDGEVKDATFLLSGNKVTSDYENGEYHIAEATLGAELTIFHPRYQTKKVVINSGNLQTISMDYPYETIAKTRYSSNYLYNDWTLSSTHTMTGISFLFSSPYDRFLSSDSALRLFLNTGSTSSKLEHGDYEFRLLQDRLFVYDYGFVHPETDISIFDYRQEVTEGKTNLILTIPYSYLGITPESIIGVTMIDSLLSQDIDTEMIFDEEAIDAKNPKEYARIDKKGRPFCNTENKDNPYWISKALKASLIEGKDYSFASPDYCNHAEDCDDIHFSIDYQENVTLDFVGFGEFKETEYIQLVIHNNIIDKNAWKLVEDDIIIQIYQDHYDLYTECSEFFSVQNGYGKKIASEKLSTFVNYGPYFRLNAAIPVSLLSNLHSEYDDFYLMAVEFNGKTLYDGKNYYENFFYKNVTRGDPADMISYALISAPKKRISKLTEAERSTLTAEKDISFANPNDTKYERADDIYLSVTRKSDSLFFDIIGFGDFSDTEIVTFVLHSSDTDGESWAIQKEDVTLMLSKNQAKTVTNTTDFWVGTRITRGNVASTLPTYERKEGYFTLQFEMKYTDISSSTNRDTPLRMYAYEFGFGGVLYNSEPWNKLMRYEGVACGDPAFQVNYIAI